MNAVLDVKDLCKSYGKNSEKKKVVDELSFQIKTGEILCLLGPNGAGKSTTINIICGLLGYEAGNIIWDGRPVAKNLNQFKSRLGVVPQELAIYEDLSAEKNVAFFASLYGIKGAKLKEHVREALEFVGLWNRKDDKAGTFSGGMKRRLNIACAIAHKPELLIMDEPTVGIDPQSRNHILESIMKLKRSGMTVLYTTHYMEEVEEIADRILIMDAGNIIAEGTTESLKNDVCREKHYEIEMENEDGKEISNGQKADGMENALYQIEGVKKVTVKDGKVLISCLKEVENLDQIIFVILKQGWKIKNLNCKKATLENVFLRLTGKSLRD